MHLKKIIYIYIFLNILTYKIIMKLLQIVTYLKVKTVIIDYRIKKNIKLFLNK